MPIRNLHDLDIFVATAEHGGLSAAARRLDLSPAVASAGLKRLEAELGTVLFVRTTRSMRLTTAGERLLVRAKTLLDGLREAEAELRAQHDRIAVRLVGHVEELRADLLALLGNAEHVLER